MILPWTAERRLTIHKDRWVDLAAERVTTGNGAVLDPYYTISYPDWAVAVALTADRQVVMIRQYRHGVRIVDLEFPGGCVDPEDSSPAEAARRELLEETGYGGDTPEYLGRYAANPAVQNNYLHVSLIRNAARIAEPALEAGEEIAVVTMPLAEVVRQATAGTMANAMHVAALFRVLAEIGPVPDGA